MDETRWKFKKQYAYAIQVETLITCIYFEDTPFLAALVYTSQHRIQKRQPLQLKIL